MITSTNPAPANGQQLRGIDRLIAHVRNLEPVRMAVVHPCDALSLGGAMDARDAGIIIPVLVGPKARLQAVAAEAGISLAGCEIVDAPHSHAAAAAAACMAGKGEVQALMKGSLHTDEFMTEVLKKDGGLRTGRRLSHVFIMRVDSYPRYLFITDAAINIQPDLMAKVDITQNAIDLTHALGIARPKVALLSAVETVTPTIQSTLDAAALCKMADRGQITGAILDGPLAFDNAISAEAAHTKHIVSAVAGDPDILVVPDLESGNMLAKQLSYLAAAASAGIVMGARVPIVLTSRAEDAQGRLASAAVANVVGHKLLTAGDD